jgi:hypothetical protein
MKQRHKKRSAKTLAAHENPATVSIKEMRYMVNHPRILCVFCLAVMWSVAWTGSWLRVRFRDSQRETQDNLGLVVSATLTLLGLIIGFTFSMATVRYDQRKLFEEEEANAIGTEYVRVDLLGPQQASVVKQKLRDYLDWRVAFYQSDYGSQLSTVDHKTAAMQADLWGQVAPIGAAQQTPVIALVISGMNDVLNRQGYSQFSWWNRIPVAVWVLLVLIGIFSSLLVGYATQRSRYGSVLLLVLPIVVSVSFYMIAEIDSPRGGLIRVTPKDLISLQQQIETTGSK